MRQGILDMTFGLIVLGIGAFLLYETTDPRYAVPLAGHEFPPMFYPRILLTLWLILSLFITVRGYFLLKLNVSAETLNLIRLAGLAAMGGIYMTWLVFAVGFLFASIAFAFPAMIFLGARHKFWVPTLAIGFPLVVWYLFQNVLGIPLPKSPWFLTL